MIVSARNSLMIGVVMFLALTIGLSFAPAPNSAAEATVVQVRSDAAGARICSSGGAGIHMSGSHCHADYGVVAVFSASRIQMAGMTHCATPAEPLSGEVESRFLRPPIA